ncbi:Asp-tRNA(Asn)/Glu-tRNA(Gln) amidotransferase subunit GatB [Patescibacteria group bacterium]
MKYQTTIGLEVHIELKTKSKMFCSCKNDPDEKRANFNICPICMGHPGVLPVINKEAVKKTIKTGLALNCQISEHSNFDRKNYFYPDLPKNYQISQLYMPFCKKGFLRINNKKIMVREVHLEEDTGKLVHPKGTDYSLVDFNRAGVPLMELVTKPDLKSSKQARKFAEELQLILRYLGVSDANMEKGQMRVEANISLGKNKKLGTKVEIKNLNSFRAVERGIEYEVERQKELLESGQKVVQETRGWNEIKGKTVSQRKKEEAHDYRYFPEPDLPTLHIKGDYVKKIKAEISELPELRRERLNREYVLDEKTIEIFVFNKSLGEYFEKVMLKLRNLVKEQAKKNEFLELTKLCSNYIISDLQGLLKEGLADKKFLIAPEDFAKFITLIYEGKISSKIAKIVLGEMFKTGDSSSKIIKEKRLSQITDKGEIEKIVKEVILKNKKAVQDFKKGKVQALQFLVGKAMKESRGKIEPIIVEKMLKRDIRLTK